MHGQRIGYVRVSSFDQNPERQLEHIQVDKVFSDKASGKDTQRPELERLLAFVREGDTVSVHYDAMLAKVIATAESRPLAIARLVAALRAFPVLGITTNIPFVIRLLESDAFREGRVHTGYLDDEGAALTSPHTAEAPEFLAEVADALRADASAPRADAASALRWDPWDGRSSTLVPR